MRLRTKLSLLVAGVLLAAFLLGISPAGQRFLIGTPSEDHWVRDDQYMGAGLAPYVYCLLPSLICFAVFGFMFSSDMRRKRVGSK